MRTASGTRTRASAVLSAVDDDLIAAKSDEVSFACVLLMQRIEAERSS